MDFGKFLKDNNLPNWAMILGFVLSTLISVAISQWSSSRDRTEQAKISAISAFEIEASRFNIAFGPFAYDVMHNRPVDEKTRQALLDSLHQQFYQVKNFEVYLKPAELEPFEKYQKTVPVVVKAVRAVNDFNSLGEAYQQIASLLDVQKDVVLRMKIKAGLADS